MKRIVTLALLSLLPITQSHAQYIAHKLNFTGSPQTANAVSGNRAVGTFGASSTRLRDDAMVWDINTGTPAFPDPLQSYTQISGDWVLRGYLDYTILRTTTNTVHSVLNLKTGQVVGLGTSASAANSSTYTAITPNLRGDWAFTNTSGRGIFIGPYNIYASAAVNLTTGQSYSFSWNTGPFDYYPRQILDVSDGRALVNLTATGYGFLDLPTGNITNISTGLSSVAGMSGNYIVGTNASGGAPAVYDIAASSTRNLGVIAGLTGAGAAMVGVNQTLGNALQSGNSHAVLWDNATGAGTDLHGFLPGSYTSSNAVSIDKNFADGSILVRASTGGGTDTYALSRFAGDAIVINTGDQATFSDDYTQTGGTVTNNGNIRFLNPSGIYNLQGGILTGGNITGGVRNGGGILSSGSSGGGSGGSGGSGGGIGAFLASGSYAQLSGGTLLLNIGGPSVFDTFTFGSAASLGGTLEIALANGFVPTIGQGFQFFSAPNIVGAWDRVVSPGYLWDLNYSSNSVTAVFRGTTSAVPSAGAAPEPSALALLAAAVPFAVLGRKRRS